MGIKTLTYLDLTPEQRRSGAKAAKDRLRSAMMNPMLTDEQRKGLQDQVAHLEKWARGLIAVVKPETAK